MNATHTMVLPTRDDTIFSAQAVFDSVDFGRQSTVVHSSPWPVLNASHWIAETDDLGIMLFCGHYIWNEAFTTREARRATRSATFAAHVQQRVTNLLTAFAHDSCKAVLVNTEFERRRAEGYLSAVGHPALAETVAGKLRVLYPAVAPRPRSVVERKWQEETPLTVMFCGRNFAEKRGASALRAFARVLQAWPDTRCIYIGEIPEDAMTEHHQVLQQIRHFPTLSHREVFAYFDQAHILFHPGMSESVGAVFIEAAAAGVAIITAAGPGYEHIEEWFDRGGASLIDRRTVAPAAEESAFAAALLELRRDVTLARRHGLYNYAMVTEGCLSLQRRDAILTPLYSRGSHEASPLTLDHFERRPEQAILSMTSDDLMLARNAYQRSTGRQGQALEVSYEL